MPTTVVDPNRNVKISQLSSDEVKVKRVGNWEVRKFPLWKRVRKVVHGEDCGDYFTRFDAPVGPTIMGGEGVTERPDGAFVYSTSLWERLGWRTMDQIPADWEAVNAATEKRAAEVNLRIGTPQAAAMLEQMGVVVKGAVSEVVKALTAQQLEAAAGDGAPAATRGRGGRAGA